MALPEGWSAYAWRANLRPHGRQPHLALIGWTAGVSIPVYKVPANLPTHSAQAALPPLTGTQLPLPAYEAKTPPPAAPAAPAPVPAPALAPPQPASDERLQALAQALQAKGLEDIWIGRMPDGSVTIRANNATYNWNTVDAVGVALAATAGELGDTRTVYRPHPHPTPNPTRRSHGRGRLPAASGSPAPRNPAPRAN